MFSMTRWTSRRKLDLVEAIRDGKLTEAEACTLHALSAEELAAWQVAATRGDDGALRARNQGRRNQERAARFRQAIA